MKLALVQDWFSVNGGAEKVVRELVDMYPDADIFSLVDFLSETDRQEILKGKKSNHPIFRISHLPVIISAIICRSFLMRLRALTCRHMI
jgi:hypothetical protein